MSNLWSLLGTSDAVVLMLAAVLALFGYIKWLRIIYLDRKANRPIETRWLLRIHDRYRHHAVGGSLVLAFWIVSGSLLLGYMFIKIFEGNTGALVSSPGVLAVIVAAFFTVWAFLNTLIIRSTQEQRIAGIASLLRNMLKTISDHRRPERDDPDKVRKIRRFYMVDYAPGLGIMTAADQHKDFRTSLMSIVMDGARLPLQFISNANDQDATVGDNHQEYKSEIQFVFYTRAKVEAYHRSIGSEPNEIAAVEKLISDLDNDVDHCGAVWRSDEIGPLHFMMIEDVAFQYIVIPKLGYSESTAIGMKSEDSSLISFLEDTIDYVIRRAVTPVLARLAGEYLEVTIRAQANIRLVRLYLSDEYDAPGKPSHTSNYPPDHGHEDFVVVQFAKTHIPEIANQRFARVMLVKHNGVRSPISESVEIFMDEADSTADSSQNLTDV